MTLNILYVNYVIFKIIQYVNNKVKLAGPEYWPAKNKVTRTTFLVIHVEFLSQTGNSNTKAYFLANYDFMRSNIDLVTKTVNPV